MSRFDRSRGTAHDKKDHRYYEIKRLWLMSWGPQTSGKLSWVYWEPSFAAFQVLWIRAQLDVALASMDDHSFSRLD